MDMAKDNIPLPEKAPTGLIPGMAGYSDSKTQQEVRLAVPQAKPRGWHHTKIDLYFLVM
jgi:hypothetical protein